MAESEDSVLPEEQVNQDSPRTIVTLVDGEVCQILLSPEAHVRCSTDREFLKAVLLQANIKNEQQTSHEEAEEKIVNAPSGNAEHGKWTDQKIKLLLSLVAELTPHTKDMIERKSAWEAISQRFEEHGYRETYFGVSKKWANLKDRYKIIIERLKKDSEEGLSSWPYFQTMENILGWRNKIPTKENVKFPMETRFASREKIPIAADSDAESPKERLNERKGKRKYGQIAGRSQKRYQRRKNNMTDQTALAPRWLTAYIGQRNKEEEGWIEELANDMSERNQTILSLAETIARFSKA